MVIKHTQQCVIDVPTDNSRNRQLNRRSYLSLAGAAALGVASSSGTAAATHSLNDDYGTVVDIVDAGADPEGGESITPVLREVADDDTLVKFPPGRYYMDEQFRFTGFSNFGLASNGATIVPASYEEFDGPQYRLFRLGVDYDPGVDLHIENFTIDQTAADTGIRAFHVEVDDGLVVRDVDVVGEHDSGTWGPGLFNITSSSGSGLVENFRAPDGGTYSARTPGDLRWGPTGIIVDVNHRGTIEFRDCELGGFPDNGLYVSDDDGQVVVRGGEYRNSRAASIRLAGQNSYVRGAMVVVDRNREYDVNQRGIRLENGSGLSVFDTTIRLDAANGAAVSVQNSADSAWLSGLSISVDGDEPNHGVVVSPEAGETVLLHSDIEQRTPGGYGLWTKAGSNSERAVAEYCTFTGSVGDDTARAAIRADRDNTQIRAVTIDQISTRYRHGIELTGDDCFLYGGRYISGGYPVVNVGDDTWMEELTAGSTGGREAVQLYDQSSGVTIKESVLENGIEDRGSAGLRTYLNEYP